MQAPLWSRDGAEVFYAAYDDPPGLIAARIDTRNGFAVTSRARVLTVPVGSSRAYDVLPGGQRFVIATSISSPEIHPQLHVVLNWPTEVERLWAK